MRIITKLYLYRLERKGFKHGKNFSMEKACNIDAGFANLISCGDNVTFTRHVYILAHDASMKKFLGKARVAAVSIGDDVFIGTYSTIMPGVTIGSNCIVAAHSCVTKDIPDGEVWGGVPARFMMTTREFLDKHKKKMTDNTYKEVSEEIIQKIICERIHIYID